MTSSSSSQSSASSHLSDVLDSSPESTVLTAQERRSSFSLASIFALRMLGLFLVLPVFSLEARHYAGAENTVLVGWAMGIYGLTQAFLQIPLGLAADRLGRKRVIVAGLIVFALGSFMAAFADSIWTLLAARAIQGAGAISAAVTALLADQTRDCVRTKSMALIGGSIALMFAISLVLSPWLVAKIGLSGLFLITAFLAILGILVILFWTPKESLNFQSFSQTGKFEHLQQVLQDASLWRLNIGVFILHAVQLAMWMVVPALLIQAGLAKNLHWQVYLPVVCASFLAMGFVFRMERKGKLRAAFLSAIGMILLAQLGFAAIVFYFQSVLGVHLLVHPNETLNLLPFWLLALFLLIFFCGFNILEATQPSLVSRQAPAHLRATAMGVYNTSQSLGFFVGGAMGAMLAQSLGITALFVVCSVALLIWLLLARSMSVPNRENQIKTR